MTWRLQSPRLSPPVWGLLRESMLDASGRGVVRRRAEEGGQVVEVIDCGTQGCQGQMRSQALVTRESREVNGLGPAEDVSGPGVWNVLKDFWCQGILLCSLAAML